MTTFEITIIVLLAAIVVLLIVLLRTAIEGFHGVWQNQDAMYQDIQRIEVNTHHASSVFQDHIAPDVKEFRDIEKTNQELLMPIIKWQRRLVGADNQTCETTGKED